MTGQDNRSDLHAQITLFEITPTTARGPLEAQFVAFHNANPHVFEACHSLALAMVDNGFRRGSIGLIFERLRWLWAAKTRGDSYKLRNAMRAFYARALMAYDPRLEGFFVTARQRSGERYEPDLDALNLSPLEVSP